MDCFALLRTKCFVAKSVDTRSSADKTRSAAEVCLVQQEDVAKLKVKEPGELEQPDGFIPLMITGHKRPGLARTRIAQYISLAMTEAMELIQ